MKTAYTPVDRQFRQVIETLVTQRKAVSIHYQSDLNELLAVTAIIKKLYKVDEAEFVDLSSGETIRLDKLVRVDEHVSPNYPGYDFSYNCSL